MAVASNPKKFLFVTGINVFVGDMIRHITTVDDQLDRVAEDFAKRIERDAKKIVAAESYETGELHDSITHARVEKGEWVIGPTAAHAKYIEYGVPARNIPPKPFMRPALDKHEKAFIDACTKVAGAI